MQNWYDDRLPSGSNTQHSHNTLNPATEVYQRKYSEKLLKAIDWAMEIDPMLRPQSAAELLDALPRWDAGDSKTTEGSA